MAFNYQTAARRAVAVCRRQLSWATSLGACSRKAAAWQGCWPISHGLQPAVGLCTGTPAFTRLKRPTETTSEVEVILDLTSQDYLKYTQGKVPFVLEVTRPSKEFCQNFSASLEAVVRSRQGVMRLGRMDVDKYQDIAAELDVAQVPTTYVFIDGQRYLTVVGASELGRLEDVFQHIDEECGHPSPIPPNHTKLDQLVFDAHASLTTGDLAGARPLVAAALEEKSRVGGQTQQAAAEGGSAQPRDASGTHADLLAAQLTIATCDGGDLSVAAELFASLGRLDNSLISRPNVRSAMGHFATTLILREEPHVDGLDLEQVAGAAQADPTNGEKMYLVAKTALAQGQVEVCIVAAGKALDIDDVPFQVKARRLLTVLAEGLANVRFSSAAQQLLAASKAKTP